MVVLSGPSGVGKDTLLQKLQEYGYEFCFVVTMTTRPPRHNEVHGKDYLFVSKDEFARLMMQDEFLEHSVVYGDYKGIPKEQVRQALSSGKDVLMRIDVQGAAKVHKIVPNAVTIFLTTETEGELVSRLSERKTETSDGLAIRIATTREEMKRLEELTTSSSTAKASRMMPSSKSCPSSPPNIAASTVSPSRSKPVVSD